jgi:hypothetical protein
MDPNPKEPAIQLVSPVERYPLVSTEYPAIIEAGHAEARFREFSEHFAAVGVVEHALVRELARHAAAMDRWGTSAEAIERQAARDSRARELYEHVLQEDAGQQDAVLAFAFSQETALRAEQQHLALSRRFHRTLSLLADIQRTRRQQPEADRLQRMSDFATEADCIQYLLARFQRGQVACECGSVSGYFLPLRLAWECAACARQVGIRSHTVMANSPLKLVVWFQAIGWLLCRPEIPAKELGSKLRMTRTRTVREIARRVNEALAGDNASQQLADLDQYFARGNPHLRQPPLAPPASDQQTIATCAAHTRSVEWFTAPGHRVRAN